MTDPRLLDTAAVAARVGVKPGTISIYLKRTRARIAQGLPLRPRDFPLPDQTISRAPAWTEATIDTWRANRPGRGHRPAD